MFSCCLKREAQDRDCLIQSEGNKSARHTVTAVMWRLVEASPTSFYTSEEPMSVKPYPVIIPVNQPLFLTLLLASLFVPSQCLELLMP